MAKYSKPTLQIAWAETGDTSPPLSSKIATGWVAERPPHEYANFVENRQDTFLRYLNQLGIPEWDASTEYQADQSYVQGSTGIVYKAKQTNTNRNPDADISFTYWGIAFDVYGSAAAVQTQLDTLNGKYPSLTGVNPASARTTLSVYSQAQVDALINARTVPVGMIGMWPVATMPSNWLECDGSAISRAGNSALFEQIGVTYGVGDGVTTFNLPDFRGYFPRGWDHGRGVDTGRAIGSNQEDDNKAHTHTIYQRKVLFRPWDQIYTMYDFRVENTSGDENRTSASSGTEARPKNIAVVFAIYRGP